MLAIVGYILGMLWNQNNVTPEASPITSQLAILFWNSRFLNTQGTSSFLSGLLTLVLLILTKLVLHPILQGVCATEMNVDSIGTYGVEGRFVYIFYCVWNGLPFRLVNQEPLLVGTPCHWPPLRGLWFIAWKGIVYVC